MLSRALSTLLQLLWFYERRIGEKKAQYNCTDKSQTQ